MTEPFAEWWDVPRDVYDADTEYLRSSALKDFADCPTIYRSRHVNGSMKQKKQSRDMIVGTCVHSLVLEGEITWKVADKCAAVQKNGNVCGNNVASDSHAAYWDAEAGVFVCGTHARGRSIVEIDDALTADEDDRVHRMAEAVEANSEATAILSDRYHERAARDIDPDTGVKRKALVDIIKTRPLLIGDLKTTGEFNDEAIWRKMDSNAWTISLAHYESVIHNVAKAKTGQNLPPIDWVILIVESVPPYRVDVWNLTEVASDVVHHARLEYQQLLADFAAAQKSGEYIQRPLTKTMPQWWYFKHGFQQESSR